MGNINFNEIRTELEMFYKKKYAQSLCGIELEIIAINNLNYHGHLYMPYTYKVRKQLLRDIKRDLKIIENHIVLSHNLQQSNKYNYCLEVNENDSTWSLVKVLNYNNYSTAIKQAEKYYKLGYSVDLIDMNKQQYIVNKNDKFLEE